MQIFLAVFLSVGIITLVRDLKDNITSTPVTLTQNLLKSSLVTLSILSTYAHGTGSYS
ncbi:uncharacterized protein RAG0_07871 [Rhynchosporium agropyri]|uniref:Uncharacterized protein n=1 Tax=Rhynchosporium agropyri TaxID=914238 RepID=A0A1E1KNB1_9HELO|nr:uncharacterized protein RAG0_07871 [Rhynchosporium agropyri]